MRSDGIASTAVVLQTPPLHLPIARKSSWGINPGAVTLDRVSVAHAACREAGVMTRNRTRWLLVGLMCLALWPGAACTQSDALLKAHQQGGRDARRQATGKPQLCTGLAPKSRPNGAFGAERRVDPTSRRSACPFSSVILVYPPPF